MPLGHEKVGADAAFASGDHFVTYLPTRHFRPQTANHTGTFVAQVHIVLVFAGIGPDGLQTVAKIQARSLDLDFNFSLAWFGLGSFDKIQIRAARSRGSKNKADLL